MIKFKSVTRISRNVKKLRTNGLAPKHILLYLIQFLLLLYTERENCLQFFFAVFKITIKELLVFYTHHLLVLFE